jgi:predicted O-methyltransferase YrrM
VGRQWPPTRLYVVSKLLYVLRRSVARPRRSLRHLWYAHVADDHGHRQLPIWLYGDLPRVSLSEALPGADDVEIRLPRVADRTFGTSISLEEACVLCAIERHFKARTVLEIGTSDGGTTLALAANLECGGRVTTVDLPPDFDLVRDRTSLAFPNERINLTSRNRLSWQFHSHPLSPRIRQVFGDSATIDWETLGGPFDLIFIDGCHTSPYVESDTENALRNLATPGAVVWHDYGLYQDVSAAVDGVAREFGHLRVFAVQHTRLAVGLRLATGEGGSR